MNAPVIFNTLAFAKRLEAAGMDMRQAEALAEALNDSVAEIVASKGDISELGRDMQQGLRDVRQEVHEVDNRLQAELRELEMRLRADLRAPELRVFTKLGAAIAGSTALTIAILGTLISFRH